MSKQIVFMTNSLASGGAERVLSVLITELVNQAYSVELITLEQNDFYDIPKSVKRTYLTSFSGKEKGLKKLLIIPFLAWKLKQYIKKNNITLIQSHVYRANYINILAKLLGAKHKVQVVNAGTISKYHNEGIVGKINLFLIKNLYKYADKIILKSKGMQFDMQKLFNFKNTQIVINNPYDIDKINILKNELVEDLKFDSSKKYLISVGRFETFKRQDYIIEALNNLPIEFELILIGDGYRKDFLMHLTNKFNLEKRVHFIGRVENPFKYIAQSNYYILSSLDGEGFPNVLVEAMICGIPVVSSDCVSGPREILSPSSSIETRLENEIEIAQYGLLFPIGKSEKIVECIQYLENNPDKKKNYVGKAQQRAKDFSLESIMKQYKKALEIE
jgi:N-acetylgalactosamine-N,N'-diacetylbacillosaminyl-diphospho-undecaprenol 4-alpha-N-acetylgalactosaminyltransferase